MSEADSETFPNELDDADYLHNKMDQFYQKREERKLKKFHEVKSFASTMSGLGIALIILMMILPVSAFSSILNIASIFAAMLGNIIIFLHFIDNSNLIIS